MKTYVKPVLQHISLTSEERFAVTSVRCTVTGSCRDVDIIDFQNKTGIIVNYSSGL